MWQRESQDRQGCEGNIKAGPSAPCGAVQKGNESSPVSSWIVLMMVHSSCLFLLRVFLGLVTSHLVCPGLHWLTTLGYHLSLCVLQPSLSHLLLPHSLRSLISPSSSSWSTSSKVPQHTLQVLPGANICSAKLFLFSPISCQFSHKSYRRAEKPETTKKPVLQKMWKRKKLPNKSMIVPLTRA